ncbi:F-box domain-containing protein [Mycena kentingensis (nom. inval.)]|nr:F-box domain-containing protein [Mycena kentingensis (nom. inval.)]
MSDPLKVAELRAFIAKRTAPKPRSSPPSGFRLLSLPPELIVEIFLHCVARAPPLTMFDEAPMILLSICRKLRSIAVSSPTLWRSFTPASSSAHLVEFADLWFSRARGVPVSLQLTLPNAGDEYVDVVERYAARIGSLTMHCSIRVYYALAARRPEFPLLRRAQFSLRRGGNLDQLETTQELDLLKSAPILESVWISGIPLSALALPSTHITEFMAYTRPTSEYFDGIRKLPSLLSCRLGHILTGDDRDSPPMLCHPAIRELSLDKNHDGGPEGASHQLLHLLILPALESLSIGFNDNLDLAPIASLVERSKCALRKLTVMSGAHKLLVDSISSFRALHHLSGLALTTPCSATLNSLFDLFGTDVEFLPRLQELKIISEGKKDDDLQDLFRQSAASFFKRAELASAGPVNGVQVIQLRSFRVEIRLRLHEQLNLPGMAELLLPFLELRQKGMDIHVGGRGGNSMI